ncbi:MlaA family lipoprotein [Yoonia sp. 208BN28-4]|uniref:MlaA family lipoprotein n=1 Tax=Yoonia sp. 208BN28-4 TaxID=3126505 RepID=UPI0030993B8D
MTLTKYLSTLIVLAILGACSTAPAGNAVNDPYEATNRQVHAFNKALDNAVFAGGDDDAAPLLHPDISGAVINFADNAGGPGMVLNGLLQGNVASAATNTFRFVLNTTVGVFGIFDPADAIGLPEVETDFAQTLAIWGVQEGAYLELPVLGPSTERDLAGRIVDSIIDPLDQFGAPVQQDYGTIARFAGRALKRDQFGDTIDSVLYDSADSYAQTRLIYLQNRRFELGVEAAEDVDPYDDLFGDQ